MGILNDFYNKERILRLSREELQTLVDDLVFELEREQREKELDARLLGALETYSGSSSRAPDRNLGPRAFERAETLLAGRR